jgi:hypothetical protein
VAELAWSTGETAGITADMVAKWERGAKGMSRRYRILLAGVYDVPVDQLGLPGRARTLPRRWSAGPCGNGCLLLDAVVDGGGTGVDVGA